MKTRSLKLGLLSILLVGAPLTVSDAQRARQGGGGDRQGAGRMNRGEMEQRVQRRLANLLQTQLGLTDEGLRQLSEVNQRFDRQRRDMLRREMMTRRAMRDEVLKRDSADTARVGQLIKEQFKIERERLDLTEAEQVELAKFLTPVQRARYLGVQEQIRREMDQLRGRGREGFGEPPQGQRGRRPPLA
jgi:Spy/CpxP family protein refolding chaperone